MKVALLVTICCCFFFSARRNKAKDAQPVPIPVSEPTPNPAMSKAPDFDKPEQFLWYIMFGANEKYSCLFRFAAAVVFFGGQLAIELIKAMR